MSLILSIETSTSVCSVALHQAGRLLASQVCYIPYSHAEYLPSTINYLLQVAHCKPDQLEAVAVSQGPGSYTGLRIGAATATGLCYTLDIPLIVINTLVTMITTVKYFYHHEAYYCPMIDARRMEVYCLVVDSVGMWLTPIEAHIVTERSFGYFLDKLPMYFFGDGAEKCKAVLGKLRNAFFIDYIYPSAEQMGKQAYQNFQEKNFTDILYFQPLYLKTPGFGKN